MNNKYLPFLCVVCISLVAWLFLPFVSYYGYSITLFDAIDSVGLGDGIGPISIIATIAGGIIGVIAALIKKKSLATGGAAVGLIGIIVCLISLMDESGADLGELFEVLGVGVWIALVGFIVSLVLARKIKDEPQE